MLFFSILRDRDLIREANKGENTGRSLFSISARKLLVHVQLSRERKMKVLREVTHYLLLYLSGALPLRAKHKEGRRRKKSDLHRASTFHPTLRLIYLTNTEHRSHFFVVRGALDILRYPRPIEKVSRVRSRFDIEIV